LAQADLYVTIGVPFETTLMQRAQSVLEQVRVVDGLAGIQRVPIGGEHGRHEGHDHSAEQPDPHVWLDPERLSRHATTVCEALVAADPSNADSYRQRLEALQKDLEDLDRWVRRKLDGLKGEAVLVFHPAYGYFTRRYGLEQVAVEVSGSTPSPRQLAQVVDRARAVGARTVFVQPQFSLNAAEAVADALDGEVVPLDPLGREPTSTIRSIAETIAAHVGGARD
jgi:zinc transport system substrate-binding protein